MGAINFNAALATASRLHARAKDGSIRLGGVTYTLTFYRYEGIYIVTDEAGEVVTRFNTRFITEAKRWLREWLA